MDTKEEILSELARLYPNAKPALHFNSPYELLVAVVLSAQCTDERVNKVTEVLFKEHNTPEKMLALSQEALEKYIFSCGFYHNKAKHILSASKDILERFGGEVPKTREELETLAGVGCGISARFEDAFFPRAQRALKAGRYASFAGFLRRSGRNFEYL